MKKENKNIKRYLSCALTPKAVSILLLFSSIVTILAFAVAYNEHCKIVVLSQKYDEAIMKINNCEALLDSVVKQIEKTTYSEVTENTPSEESTVPTETTTLCDNQTSTNTESGISASGNKTEASQPVTTENNAEKTSSAVNSDTSGPYFVTQSGNKYHIASCSYLSKSKIAITMDRIRAGGYSPCSRCIK